jgi:hypothetical protein
MPVQCRFNDRLPEYDANGAMDGMGFAGWLQPSTGGVVGVGADRVGGFMSGENERFAGGEGEITGTGAGERGNRQEFHTAGIGIDVKRGDAVVAAV